MRRQRLLLITAALASLTLWTYGCGDGTTEPPPDPPRPTAVTVSPATTELAALGATVQLTAQVLDQNGQVMTGASVTWASSAASVATVNPSGLVTAVANGAATITATAGQASGSAAVTVAQVARSVTVAPTEANFAALGDTLRLTAEAHDANGHAVSGAQVSWETSDDTLATVNASGLVTAVANGTATITATAGQASGSAAVIVAQVVSAVAVAPDTAMVVEGDTLRLAATATDSNGHAVAAVEFVWASGDTLVAVVDASGLVTGVGTGRVQLTATTAEITGRGELTVVARMPASIAVTPDTVVLGALGHTAQLTAEVRDQTGRVMDGVPVVWSSGDTTIAVVDSSGLVRAVRNGEVMVTATAGEASGGAHVNVRQSAGSVTLSPPADTVSLGDTLRLVAEAYDETGHLVEGTVFAWSSSDAAVATVDPLGLVRGAGEGTATVTATAGDVSGTSEITVTNPDRAALVALYHATDGPNWVDNTNWLTDAPLGEWYGVETNAAGRVVGLDLSGRFDYEARLWTEHGLQGEFPVEIANLTGLTRLNLRANDLNGSIPPELGGLENLKSLNLISNRLSGPIPPELGGLSNLVELILTRNDLSGPIPSELGELAHLSRLSLGANALSGEIPQGLAGLLNLQWLVLAQNALSGAIPPELGSLSNLVELNLYGNALSGAIPPELGDLANLRYLYLHQNNLSGPIPPGLGNLEELIGLLLVRNDLTGEIPPELGDLSNLESLNLRNNRLSGPIPPELGDLSSLELLGLGDNDLSGTIPPELGGLEKLEWLGLGGNELGAFPQTFVNLRNLRYANFECSDAGICVPGTSGFVGWTKGLADADRLPFCNASDQAVLTSFYELAAGDEWTESGGWLGGPALAEWHGVETDSLGHVTALVLSDNGLSGSLPGAIADLGQLTRLRIDDNALGGRLPLSLTTLDLEEFHYDGTDLCEPEDAGFRDWLDGIPSHQGTAVQCPPLTERDALVALYASTGGPGWRDNGGWLTEAPLRLWSGVEVDAQGRVVTLDLSWNELSGVIPPELGSLSNLRQLNLGRNALSGVIPPELGLLSNLEQLYVYWNELSGVIPPELGSLSNLKWLNLGWNALSGVIPPELGGLANLRHLSLYWNELSGAIPPELGALSDLGLLNLNRNELSGAIPPELGDLSNLWQLDLNNNDLSGVIPPELGGLSNLRSLSLIGNAFSGPIPPTFGGLAGLIELELSHNAGLAGAMPAGLRNLALESLLASGTELCVPREPAFEEWLATIPMRRITACGEPPAAYLVQAVQSRAHPVPLVAGEDALLRVFVTAAMETTEGIPEVRARFFLNGSERHVVDIPGSSTPIPTEIDESDLAMSANAEIPGRIVRPGLEMVVEIDPDGVLDTRLGVPGRIPQEGRLAVVVREVPVLDLTVIPFLWNSDPDSAIIGLVEGMAADPEGHALLEDTHVLLPVDDIDVTARAPVASTSNDAFDLLAQTEALRVLEGGVGHYKGMMSGVVTGAAGVAYLGGRSSFSRPSSYVIAHELGHNMGLAHAPCGSAPRPDPSFPYPDGTIGAWGYDFRRGFLVSAAWRDHMTYCGPTWTSDYHFTNALSHRLADEGASASALASATTTSLLLWGGVDTTGTPFLNPAFVADASPTLPDSAGDYTVMGRDARARELFSLNFTMPVALSEEAEMSSFVFALPVQPGWADALASVTLSGTAGTATMDADSDIPMAILRDPATGRVRGFLRDMVNPVAGQTDALVSAGGLDVLFSRGIPDVAAWQR